MSAEFGNEIDLGMMPVAEFGQTTPPDPSKPKAEDLSILIQKLTVSIDNASKRQHAAKKARDTIEAKSDDDKFKKVALRLAEGRLGKANDDLVEMRRQLSDLRRIQHIREQILLDKIEENKDLQEEVNEARKEDKQESRKLQETLQEGFDSVAKANEKFEGLAEDLAAPVKAITENNILLGSIAEDFGTIFSTISNSWGQLKGFANSIANLGMRGAKVVDKFTAKSENKDSEVDDSESENSEVTPVEASELNESQRGEFEASYQEVPGQYTLKQAVADLKEANHIDTQKIIKSDKIQTAASTKSTNKYLRSIKNSVAQIRQSMLFRTMLELSKFAIIAAVPAAIAQIVDSVKQLWHVKDDLWEAIKWGVGEITAPIREAINNLRFSFTKNLKAAGDSLIDMVAAKNDKLATARSKNYEKTYSLSRYSQLANKKETQGVYAEIKGALARTKSMRDEIDKLKKEGADWETILATQRAYVNTLLDDSSLSVKARQYLAGENYEDLQAPAIKREWKPGEIARSGAEGAAVGVFSDTDKAIKKNEAEQADKNVLSQVDKDLWYPAHDPSASPMHGSQITASNRMYYKLDKGYKTANEARESSKPKTEVAPIPPESKKPKKSKKSKKAAASSTPPAANVNNVTNIVQGQNASIRPELGYVAK